MSTVVSIVEETRLVVETAARAYIDFVRDCMAKRDTTWSYIRYVTWRHEAMKEVARRKGWNPREATAFQATYVQSLIKDRAVLLLVNGDGED